MSFDPNFHYQKYYSSNHPPHPYLPQPKKNPVGTGPLNPEQIKELVGKWTQSVKPAAPLTLDSDSIKRKLEQTKTTAVATTALSMSSSSSSSSSCVDDNDSRTEKRQRKTPSPPILEEQTKTASDNPAQIKTWNELPLYENLDQFVKHTDFIKALTTFKVRMEALQKCLGYVQDKDYAMWIDSGNKGANGETVSWKLSLKATKYFSKALDASCFPNSVNSQQYRIEVHEHVGENDPSPVDVLSLRACENDGEFVWLCGGRVISGTETVQLFKRMHKLLGIRICLYDDATVTLKTLIKSQDLLEIEKLKKEIDVLDRKKFVETPLLAATQKLNKLEPKVYLNASHAIGRDDKKTWYQRVLNAKVMTCKNWKMGNTEGAAQKEPKIINQAEEPYDMSLERVRNLKIKDLCKFYPKSKFGVKKFPALMQRLFPLESFKKFVLENCSKTLHDLEKAASTNVKEALSEKARIIAEKDQYFIHQHFFYPYNVGENASVEETTFLTDLQTIDGTRVLVIDP